MEIILGVQRDPVFGPIIIFGLGGIFVEALKDVTFGAAPFDEAKVRAMIGAVAAWSLLTGLRGQSPAGLDTSANALSRLYLFVAANEATIESLDINPFLVRPEGAPLVTSSATPLPRPLRPPAPGLSSGSRPRLTIGNRKPRIGRAEFASRTIDDRTIQVCAGVWNPGDLN